MRDSKAWPITKRMVWAAFKKVKRNKGAAGVDGQSIADFEDNLQDNLYILWNRMTSGSYFPPAIRRVEIPKKDGKKRVLGIATVSDRIAQTVVKQHIEPEMEGVFHDSSYGYRPGRSAHDALEKTRRNCWDYPWVIDLDIQGFFDTLDHDLLLKALERHCQEKWVMTYVRRWLKAPMLDSEGNEEVRTVGSPQGSVVSPVLANLFLHYVFDKWMEINFPDIKFERYVDDIVIHCKTEEQAENLLERISKRMAECKLTVHPEKTKIVYCRVSNRKLKTRREVKFDFLGYEFRPRESQTKEGKIFHSFSPAISKEAKKRIVGELRELKLHKKSRSTLEEIGLMINSKLRGWIQYYGKFRRSALRPIFYNLNIRLLKWVRGKYKNYRFRKMKALYWLRSQMKAKPSLFEHWSQGFRP